MMASGITLRHVGTTAKWSCGWTMDRDRWGCVQNVCWIQVTTASAWLWTGNLDLKLSLAFWSMLRVAVFGYWWLWKVVFLVNTFAAFGHWWLLWKVIFLVNTFAASGHCWLLWRWCIGQYFSCFWPLLAVKGWVSGQYFEKLFLAITGYKRLGFWSKLRAAVLGHCWGWISGQNLE